MFDIYRIDSVNYSINLEDLKRELSFFNLKLIEKLYYFNVVDSNEKRFFSFAKHELKNCSSEYLINEIIKEYANKHKLIHNPN